MNYQYCQNINREIRDYSGHFWCKAKGIFVIPAKTVKPRCTGPVLSYVCASDCPWKKGGAK